jgi:hypothetical protein
MRKIIVLLTLCSLILGSCAFQKQDVLPLSPSPVAATDLPTESVQIETPQQPSCPQDGTWKTFVGFTLQYLNVKKNGNTILYRVLDVSVYLSAGNNPHLLGRQSETGEKTLDFDFGQIPYGIHDYNQTIPVFDIMTDHLDFQTCKDLTNIYWKPLPDFPVKNLVTA